MQNKMRTPEATIADRIISIDFFRGVTMFLLIGESSRLFKHLLKIDSGFFHFLGTQLSHHQWHGLYFWDLIQPFFTFIVGVAIPFAVANRLKKGDSERSICVHAFKRSFLLLLLGWAIYCIGPGKIVFRFQNVLAQLSVAYLGAFLIRNKSWRFQVITTLVILCVVDLAYRFFPVEGFNHPWVAYENFGSWVNNKIEGVEKASIWASINAFPTTAHTIWGVLCGQLLMSKKTTAEKLKYLLSGACACLLAGYSLDILGVTPIIKKIATASFVFVSGGYAILALTFFYWLIDVKKVFIKGSKPFRIVGMNCIFIYLFCQVGGARMIQKIVTPFTTSLLGWAGDRSVAITTSLLVWAGLWYICYWLYRNRLFIKI